MRNIIALIFILLSNTTSCISQNRAELDSVRKVVAKFLLDKGEWKDQQYSKYIETGKGFSIRGIYNKLNSEKLKEGIYWVYRGTHTREYFLLYKNKETNILDISTQEELSKSIGKILKYFSKQEFCVEIINEYLSKMIGIHYSINKNIRRRSKDPNCKKKYKAISSQIDLRQLKLKLAEYLIKKNKLKDVNEYLDDPEYLVVEATDLYYGISKEKGDIDVGMYFFLNNQDPNLQVYYLLVGEGNYEILTIDNNESLNESINDILSFTQDNGFCHKIAISYIKELINAYYSNSCLESFKNRLP